jgi:hypothetical protein
MSTREAIVNKNEQNNARIKVTKTDRDIVLLRKACFPKTC